MSVKDNEKSPTFMPAEGINMRFDFMTTMTPPIFNIYIYFEFVFPEKQIRYIAVAENEDTEKWLSDFVPFKNLFNEWFAKDTSRKVKIALHAKFVAGQKICTYAPLGYVKHPEIKNSIVVDPETSWIIEKIFDLALHGSGAAKITRMLVAEKVPTAGYLNYKRYGTFANIYAGVSEEKSYAWTIAQVKSILKDETYIGNIDSLAAEIDFFVPCAVELADCDIIRRDDIVNGGIKGYCVNHYKTSLSCFDYTICLEKYK